ncbi:HNH endonuclease signature motif containing protein [Streptomyces sp. 2MCAF27]
MRDHEVIAEFYQVHIERGLLKPGDVPSTPQIAAEWVVRPRMAGEARALLVRDGFATRSISRKLPLGPISDMDYAWRFLPKVQPRNSDGCLLWDASVSGGYGQFHLNGRYVRAHRVAWEYRNGPVPEGLELDHVFARGCRSPLCVNTEHLEVVTRSENELRKYAAARWMASIRVSTELDDE